MIQYNPFFKLNKLIIISKNGNIAYEQEFHDGVNIIRGDNSTGKSTITNFIFYVLGGDFKKWNRAALSCQEVIAEVTINSEIVSLKRQIVEASSQPMYIFWGTLEEIFNKKNIGWQVFPYRKTTDKKSFSNALFMALGFPELKGDIDSNITMHQILRLLYVDQKSLTLDLMMTDSFDSAITRRTVADLLFGVYNDQLYSSKLNLRNSEKELEIKKKQLEGIIGIFRSSGNDINELFINNMIIENEKRLEKIEESINNFDYENIKLTIANEDAQSKIIFLREKLFYSKQRLSDLQKNISEYEFELIDSYDFIIALENRLDSLKDSLLTREVFGYLDVNHCPNCLSTITNDVPENHCVLCKNLLPEDIGFAQVNRMQQEIDNQIRESKKIYKEKEHQLLAFKTSVPNLQKEINALQIELNEEVKYFKPTANKIFEGLLIKKGELKTQNEYLLKQLKTLEQLDVLKQEVEGLEGKILSLKKLISDTEEQQALRLRKAFLTIQDYAIGFLKSDVGNQTEFKFARKIELDFNKNTFSVDDENNFSESSNVYLKNSIRFAIFFASLNNDFFRLPRFILCDNIEDKGMQPERSHRFQNKIVEFSLENKVRHQIIFSTSMISEKLNDSKLCVGEYYTETNKTLKF